MAHVPLLGGLRALAAWLLQCARYVQATTQLRRATGITAKAGVILCFVALSGSDRASARIHESGGAQICTNTQTVSETADGTILIHDHRTCEPITHGGPAPGLPPAGLEHAGGVGGGAAIPPHKPACRRCENKQNRCIRQVESQVRNCIRVTTKYWRQQCVDTLRRRNGSPIPRPDYWCVTHSTVTDAGPVVIQHDCYGDGIDGCVQDYLQDVESTTQTDRYQVSISTSSLGIDASGTAERTITRSYGAQLGVLSACQSAGAEAVQLCAVDFNRCMVKGRCYR